MRKKLEFQENVIILQEDKVVIVWEKCHNTVRKYFILYISLYISRTFQEKLIRLDYICMFCIFWLSIIYCILYCHYYMDWTALTCSVQLYLLISPLFHKKLKLWLVIITFLHNYNLILWNIKTFFLKYFNVIIVILFTVVQILCCNHQTISLPKYSTVIHVSCLYSYKTLYLQLPNRNLLPCHFELCLATVRHYKPGSRIL